MVKDMKQKKMVIINDVTGFGRCSVAVMLPIVSAMRIQGVVVPTAILSTHTQFSEYYFDDYTPKMRDYIQTYKNLDLEFDGIATGFLGSEEQVDIVIDFIRHFREKASFVLIDPVMGDYGKLYTTYTLELCNKMKELVQYADILTPNLTELCMLLDEEYMGSAVTLDQLKDMCERLCQKGPKQIVVTGIAVNKKQLLNFVYSDKGDYQIVMVDKIGEDRSGTGDVISAVIAGMYMNGHSLYDSVKKAARYVSKCIKYCEKYNYPNNWGLCFEMYLKDLIR